MTTVTEKKAEDYLFNKYNSSSIRFEKSTEDKFDLWIVRGEKRTKGELKASLSQFKSNGDISKNLVFNSQDEKELFEKGETEIVRVFLGDDPPSIFIVNNNLINGGVEFERDQRYTLKGKRNYGSDAIKNISSKNSNKAL